MPYVLPQLPYPIHALEPKISAETFEFHHGKHHRAYVQKLNELIQGTEFEKMDLEDIITRSKGPIFNNAAQHWNHTFFWSCFSPEKTKPNENLLKAIERDFGSLDHFLMQFKTASSQLFGSGWVWLAKSHPHGQLSIESLSNAVNPLVTGKTPILTCDVWEHAYYIDYRNERLKFVDAFISLLNWEFANENFKNVKETYSKVS